MSPVPAHFSHRSTVFKQLFHKSLLLSQLPFRASSFFWRLLTQLLSILKSTCFCLILEVLPSPVFSPPSGHFFPLLVNFSPWSEFQFFPPPLLHFWEFFCFSTSFSFRVSLLFDHSYCGVQAYRGSIDNFICRLFPNTTKSARLGQLFCIR